MFFELVKIIYAVDPSLLDILDIYEKVRTDKYGLFVSNMLFVCYKQKDKYLVQSIVEGKVIETKEYSTEESAKLALHHLALTTMRSLLSKLVEDKKDNV